MDYTRIKQARKVAGVTQEQLANMLVVNRATVSKYESGQIEPTFSVLENIASALGIHVFDLIGTGRKQDKEVAQVAQDYANLDQWGRQAVRSIIAVEQERMRNTS